MNIIPGGEYDNITFESTKSKGNGIYYGGFIGFELFLSPIISFSSDIGYGQITIKDETTSIDNSNSHILVISD